MFKLSLQAELWPCFPEAHTGSDVVLWLDISLVFETWLCCEACSPRQFMQAAYRGGKVFLHTACCSALAPEAH